MGRKQGVVAEDESGEAVLTYDETPSGEENDGQDNVGTAEDDDELLWLQDEEPDSSEDDGDSDDDEDDEDEAAKEGGVPVAKYVAIKQKLKGKLTKEQEENDALKKRIAELEAKKADLPANLEKPKLPKRSQFQSDEEHEAALEKYSDDLIKFIPQAMTATADTEKEQKEYFARMEEAVEGHTDRAAKLIVDHQIDPDVYKKSQDNVKAIIQKAIPHEGAGEAVFNQYVSLIGEGSEKTMFYVGRNKAASDEFARLMLEDKTGLKAAFFLGATTKQIAGNKNISSRAPKPASNLKGGGLSPANESALKRKYDEAHRKGQGGKAFSLKRQAKAAKIDTSKW